MVDEIENDKPKGARKAVIAGAPTKYCHACGKKIPKTADKCPHCDALQGYRKLTVFWLPAIGAASIIASGLFTLWDRIWPMISPQRGMVFASSSAEDFTYDTGARTLKPGQLHINVTNVSDRPIILNEEIFCFGAAFGANQKADDYAKLLMANKYDSYVEKSKASNIPAHYVILKHRQPINVPPRTDTRLSFEFSSFAYEFSFGHLLRTDFKLLWRLSDDGDWSCVFPIYDDIGMILRHEFLLRLRDDGPLGVHMWTQRPEELLEPQ